ncbi:MAG: bifunctional pyr operon transcriptional regulator/uracil phosphoribosyltransferase PyrR [Firmicutes bacterium]|nr:bifunctional pyr operon transcriptional regulator/uracil phosphoribosyltransferase PyrR [Bacillota bacterium]
MNEGSVVLLDEAGMRRALARIAYEIIERSGSALDELSLVGVRTRGYDLALRLVARIAEIEQVGIPCHALDVSSFRDDISTSALLPRQQLDPTFLGAIDKRRIILVDDVLFTGRTVRAALDALTTGARPSLIQLAVLIDRGHRELPIRPDYVGKNIPTARSERVRVHVVERDQKDDVILQKRGW